MSEPTTTPPEGRPALLILACSATKRPDAGALPAIARYDGPGFRVLRRALRERAGLSDVLTIRILSAEFGLITDTTAIPDYNRRMDRPRARELYLGVQHAINELRPLPLLTYIDVGARYLAALPPLPEQRIEWATGGIGYRLGQLKAWLWGLPL